MPCVLLPSWSSVPRSRLDRPDCCRPAWSAVAHRRPASPPSGSRNVDPLDHVSLADALERVLTDQDLRARLSAAGRERAAEYTWQAAGRRVLRILETLA